MKKFIISFVKFLIFTVLFCIMLLMLWGRYTPASLRPNIKYIFKAYGHSFTRFNEVEKFKNIDILFLGSSHAYRGFDPRIFEKSSFKTFNLGSSSQTPFQTEILIKKYLDSLNPKLIIYEVYPGSFTSDGIESSLDIISNDEIDYEVLKLALKQHHLKIYNTLVYSYIHANFRKISNNKNKYIENKKKGKDSYVSGGYVEKELDYYKFKSYSKEKWNFKEDQFLTFERIVAEIKKRKIKLIFVQAPITSNFYNSRLNNKYFDERLSKYGTYINFNKILKLDDSLHFYDQHHLNQKGVEMFNQALIEKLVFKK